MSKSMYAALCSNVADIFHPKNTSIVLSAILKTSWIPLLFFGTQALGGGAAAGEALTQATDIIKQALILIIGVIAAIAFIVVAYSVLSKFNDARRGRGEWGEVIVPFVIGAGLLVLIAWLIEQATTAANAIGGAA